MKTLITSLGLAAVMSVGLISTSVSAGEKSDAWLACHAEYNACLKDGTNLSISSTPGDAVNQTQSNMSNWASCNSALAACYKGL